MIPNSLMMMISVVSIAAVSIRLSSVPQTMFDVENLKAAKREKRPTKSFHRVVVAESNGPLFVGGVMLLVVTVFVYDQTTTAKSRN